MKKVVFSGWLEGCIIINFVRYLMDNTDLGLIESKQLADSVLMGGSEEVSIERISIDVEDFLFCCEKMRLQCSLVD